MTDTACASPGQFPTAQGRLTFAAKAGIVQLIAPSCSHRDDRVVLLHVLCEGGPERRQDTVP